MISRRSCPTTIKAPAPADFLTSPPQSAAYNQPISPQTQLPGTNLLPQLVQQRRFRPASTDSRRATNSLEGTNDKVDLVALDADYDLGFATLTSSAPGRITTIATDADLTALYTNFQFLPELSTARIRARSSRATIGSTTKCMAQEFRLASKTGGMFDWVGGLFYKDEKTYIQEHEYYPGYNDFYPTARNQCRPIRRCERLDLRIGEYVNTGSDHRRRHPAGTSTRPTSATSKPTSRIWRPSAS